MAERKTLVKIEYISDHSCGTYEVGEIDTLTKEPIAQYVDSYGEKGYIEVLEMCARMSAAAVEAITKKRNSSMPSASMKG